MGVLERGLGLSVAAELRHEVVEARVVGSDGAVRLVVAGWDLHPGRHLIGDTGGVVGTTAPCGPFRRPRLDQEPEVVPLLELFALQQRGRPVPAQRLPNHQAIGLVGSQRLADRGGGRRRGREPDPRSKL